MSARIFQFIKDVIVDGYKFVGGAAPLLSISFTLGKFFLGDQLKFIQDLSYAWALLPVVVWLTIAYTRRRSAHMEDQRELLNFRDAWDRSGRNLIPIKDAIEIVMQNLADQWPEAIAKSERRERAACKLREIGWENQAPIWGREYVDETKALRDLRIQIPPTYWNGNIIDCDLVFSDNKAQTKHDEDSPDKINISSRYGDLKINKAKLEAMCPPKKD